MSPRNDCKRESFIFALTAIFNLPVSQSSNVNSSLVQKLIFVSDRPTPLTQHANRCQDATIFFLNYRPRDTLLQATLVIGSFYKAKMTTKKKVEMTILCMSC